MNLIKYHLAAFFILMLMGQPVVAAGSKYSFSKSVQQGGTTFDINSRSAVDSAVQIVTVTVRRGGKKVAGMKSDVDYLAHSAQAIDLTGDGAPELALFSRTTGEIVTETLDVYLMNGTTLSRLPVPDIEEKSGYRGGDRYHLEDNQIVRTIPVYRDGDQPGKPTGGTRALKYLFKDGAFTLYVQTEKAADPQVESSVQKAPQAAESKPAVPAGAALAITEITVTDAGIEIRANAAVAKYRTVRLDKPERIAIDFPGAESSLTGKKITINRFGISRVRVGRNKGFMRVVLDPVLDKFPKHEVKSSASGVLIEFTQ